MTAKRTRGRPPAGDAADRRAAILDAARAQFAAQGFGATSMRSIARDAGVDVSLISHYFGDKSGLLVATMELPVNPIEKIASVIEDGPDGMAERLLRTFLGAWDPNRDIFSSMYRTTLGSGDAQAPMLELARNILITALLKVLEGDDRELRAIAHRQSADRHGDDALRRTAPCARRRSDRRCRTPVCPADAAADHALAGPRSARRSIRLIASNGARTFMSLSKYAYTSLPPSAQPRSSAAHSSSARSE